MTVTERVPVSTGIIVGQHVQPNKQQRAKELRQSMTKAETLLWHHLRANRLDGMRWRRQQVIDGFIADFYCHNAGLIVELDGAVHMLQPEYDSARDKLLTTRDLLILRCQ
jgi:very-short-patch-repair endonuclease